MAWISQFELVESVQVRVAVAVGVSWGTRCQRENQLADWGFGPSVTHCWARWERSAAMVARRTLGQYVAVCPRLQLTSHTQPTSTLSNKVWEVYFYKELWSFVHWISSLCLIMFSMYYVYVCGYTTYLVYICLRFIYIYIYIYINFSISLAFFSAASLSLYSCICKQYSLFNCISTIAGNLMSNLVYLYVYIYIYIYIYIERERERNIDNF